MKKNQLRKLEGAVSEVDSKNRKVMLSRNTMGKKCLKEEKVIHCVKFFSWVKKYEKKIVLQICHTNLICGLDKAGQV